MDYLRQLCARLAGFFRRRDLEAEMAEEMRQHLERRIQEKIADGLAPEDAHYAAQREFGGTAQVQEQCRDERQRGFVWLDRLVQDLHYAARALRKNPGFTLVSTITLAFALGVNTSVFTLFYSIALRPLPVKEPESIVNVFQYFAGEFSRQVLGNQYLLSYEEYTRYRDRVGSLSGLAAFRDLDVSLGGADTEKVGALLVTDDYFSVLRGDPALGRFFRPGECQSPGEHPLAVLSYGCWQRRFGGDPAIVGRRVTLNRTPFTVIGVAAADFRGTSLRVPEFWLPLTMQPLLAPGRNYLSLRNASWLEVVGRLKPGISRQAASTEMSLVAAQADLEYAGRKTIITLTAGTLVSSPAVAGKGSYLGMVGLVVMALILLIACSNIMNLLLMRAATRRVEIGVRLALGASRGRLIQQMLTETLLLAFLGGAAGMLVAYWLPPILLQTMPNSGIQVDVRPDLVVFAYGFGIATVAAAIFGVAPALEATRIDPLAALKGRGRRLSQSQVRNGLVVVQVAGSLVLLIGAMLLVRGLLRTQSLDLGYDPKSLLVLSVDAPNLGNDDTRMALRARELRERLRAYPDVRSVSFATVAPMEKAPAIEIVPEGREGSAGAPVAVEFNAVSADYFSALGLPLVRGRFFSEVEAESGVRVAIVSEAMAQRFWPGGTALGRRFTMGGFSHEVVGVTRDDPLAGILVGNAARFYVPARVGQLIVATTGPSAPLVAALAGAARAVDRDSYVTVTRVADRAAHLLHPHRSGSIFSGVLGLLALVLAAIGIYGVLSYSVAQRTRELGVRMALGATRREVLHLVLKQGMRLAGWGIGIGLLAATGTTHVLTRALVGISPLDPLSFGGVSLLIAATALWACYVPARRAAKVDPMVALRSE